jgi:hypothetical protein
MSSGAVRVVRVVGYGLLRAAWVATMVVTPLFGFWLASSLAAYENATQWLALLGGLLLFPILPVGWDLVFVWRRSKQPPRRAILTRLDRLVLRTLIVNGVFLGGMMYFAHGTAFRALAVRGDWFLDGYDGPAATSVRRAILAFADRFDGRRVVDDDRYGAGDDAPDGEPGSDGAWPLPAAIDPLVSEMPESAQRSITAVGSYLAARFPDPRQRVKALHDYVALRLHYDDAALRAIEARDRANIPPQDAEPVFAARTGVCAGYAKLMVALGKAAGVEIAYVTGYARDRKHPITTAGSDAELRARMEGDRHAWNAAKLDGRWYLLDVTWDDAEDRPIESTYLFTPPELMTLDHLPEDPAWQLRTSPISLGDFVRQPLLRPEFAAFGLALEEPTRSQISVSGTARVVIRNPRHAKIAAVAAHGDDQIRCAVESSGDATTATCDLPDGEYELRLFAAAATSTRGTLDHVGSILVNSR